MNPGLIRKIARWAGAAALAAALTAGAIFVHRHRLASKDLQRTPAAVPPSVQQRSLQFTFAKTEGEQTVFTIHAARAIQYRGSRGSVLEDVDIVVHGEHGERRDEIRTRSCDYDSASGSIVCRGTVDLKLSSSPQSKAAAPVRTTWIYVQTRDVSFDRDSGEARTDAPVTFRFPEGEGSGVGADYSSRAADFHVRREVAIHLAPAGPGGGATDVTAKGGLTFHRKLDQLRMAGPVEIREGGRLIDASALTVDLNDQWRPRRAIFAGETVVRIIQGTRRGSFQADSAEIAFSSQGRAEGLNANGHVVAIGEETETKLEAQRAFVTLNPGSQQPRSVELDGDVRLDAKRPAGELTLNASSLNLEFSPAAVSAKQAMLARAFTLGEASVAWLAKDEQLVLKSGNLAATFGQSDQIEKLAGEGGVELERRQPKQAPLITTARRLEVNFSQGRWSEAEESGNVRAKQGVRSGQAEKAVWLRNEDEIELSGAAQVNEPAGATSADTIEWNQESGQLQAIGRVRTSYAGETNRESGGFATGPVDVVAMALDANTATGQAVYSGGARLWSGDQVVQADRIALDRADRELVATGNVIAAFPQAMPQAGTAGANGRGSPVLWRVKSSQLQYAGQAGTTGHSGRIVSGGQGQVRLNGGIDAWSSQGRIEAKTLLLSLSRAPNGQAALTQATASGGVRVRQGGRSGQAENATYDAQTGKFVLWGGEPSLEDASGDLVTGDRLTFSEADDTILIESSEGSRTLTKHPVPN